MNSQEYRSILGRLPLKSPSPEDMALFCPHVTKEEALAAFTTGSGYVACPPLRVRHGFQIVSYQKEYVEEIKVWRVVDGKDTQMVVGTKNHPAQLRQAYAGRTRASYMDGESHGDIFSRYQCMDEAMKFAEDNWGDELVLDDWEDVAEFYVQDPTDLVSDRYHSDYPRTKAVLGVALKRGFNAIMNDHHKPKSELFDDAIAQLTIDSTLFYEIKGGRGGYTEYNCANCGAGLLLTSCSGCDHRFRDDHFRCGWYTPLSRKMVAFLRDNGHVFKVDPEVAWLIERKQWELSHHKKVTS